MDWSHLLPPTEWSRKATFHGNFHWFAYFERKTAFAFHRKSIIPIRKQDNSHHLTRPFLSIICASTPQPTRPDWYINYTSEFSRNYNHSLSSPVSDSYTANRHFLRTLNANEELFISWLNLSLHRFNFILAETWNTWARLLSKVWALSRDAHCFHLNKICRIGMYIVQVYMDRADLELSPLLINS